MNWGVGEEYENVGRRAGSNVTNASLSGGIQRSQRARSQKRELVDSWFSQSFHNSASNSNGGESSGESEGQHLSKNYAPRKPASYRGCKTTSNLDARDNNKNESNNDWDFLTKLNEILRQENFIGAEEEEEKVVPLSPRPPRPTKRGDRRNNREQMSKTKSLLVDPPKPVLSHFHPNGLGERAHSPFQNMTQRAQTPNREFQHYYNNNNNHQQQAPSLPPKTSSNNLSNCSIMSNSLDSIYDRLKGSEAFGNHLPPQAPQNQRPMTQIYPFASPGYNNPMYFYGSGNIFPPYFDPRFVPNPYEPYRSRSFGSLKGSVLGLDYEDRLLRLESDKETLHLQVSVLSDQIEAQTDKIKDLERLLDDKRNVLETTEEQLQRELLTRSSLETSKLELLTELSSLRLKQASLERENIELKERFSGKSLGELNYSDGNNGGSSRNWDKPPHPQLLNGNSSIRAGSPSIGRIGSSENFQRTRTPPANAYRRVDQQQSHSFGTVPRRSNNLQQLSPETFSSSTSSSNGKSTSFSSGNIAAIHYNNNHAMDKHEWERNRSLGKINVNGNPLPLSLPPSQLSNSGKDKTQNGSHKSRGIMRIFGKLRRSNSGGLDSDQISPAELALAPGPAPFTRGGVRATAAPRLGWVPNKEQNVPKMPEGHITSWDSVGVIQWLSYIGLGIYSGDVKRWVKTGTQLLNASPQELEKELGIKNQLHKKKLVLALASFRNMGNEEDFAGRLDYQWVIRWLDDVGLPQYKETFGEARVDGRVLNLLTTDDLISLKVHSVLHHASIKRGIQLLRIHKFHPDCLVRRGGPTPGLLRHSNSGPLGVGNNNGSNGSGDYGSSDGGSSVNCGGGSLQVASWSNHRVMEWLKAIDLAEYAPNLRGSGVHGALIIFESRFNSELMATLLAIPSNKSLLRRHLSLQINELVGKVIMGEKRAAELAPDFIAINPMNRVKAVKKTQFPPLKQIMTKKKNVSAAEYAAEELLCPQDLCVFPYRSDSVGQLSSLDASFEDKEKVSNII